MSIKFELGRLVATRGVADLAMENKDFYAFVNTSIKRYVSGDWGEMAKEDRAMNDEAVSSGEDRIHASYTNPTNSNWKIWIITEWDRSVTTVLFPSEY